MGKPENLLVPVEISGFLSALVKSLAGTQAQLDQAATGNNQRMFIPSFSVELKLQMSITQKDKSLLGVLVQTQKTEKESELSSTIKFEMVALPPERTG